ETAMSRRVRPASGGRGLWRAGGVSPLVRAPGGSRPPLAMACLLLALLPARLPAQGVPQEPRTDGNLTARLSVQVAGQGAGAGRASVWYHLVVEGPAGLEVEPARLDDPTSAWKAWRESAWALAGERAVWGQGIRLDQLKEGKPTLPDVKVRFR